eukprot:NODE_19912_length_172_cov_0.821138_g19297_i0.p1 GENE.NODE_19912_length_172_cov_0.821138_g19297_i0~~NODE_19912_length_172_cov_0.821138_g19297_i0.p1  ORF type:complete len:50 (+),score=8.81 NODE_19912_length_172_cov_0.821138_g19297_i0:1-150(+)
MYMSGVSSMIATTNNVDNFLRTLDFGVLSVVFGAFGHFESFQMANATDP